MLIIFRQTISLNYRVISREQLLRVFAQKHQLRLWNWTIFVLTQYKRASMMADAWEFLMCKVTN